MPSTLRAVGGRKCLSPFPGITRGDLAKRRFVTHGSDIYVTTSDRAVLKSVLKRGQLAFSVFLLGEIVQEAGRRLELYEKNKATG